MQVRLTPRAESDLNNIADFTIERWSEQQATVYIDRLKDRFVWLAENPRLGRIRDDVKPGYRCYLQGSHVIFYEIGDDEIFIIGIPHAAADFGAYFDN